MRKELKDAFTAQELRQKPLESDYNRFLNALDALKKNTNDTESEEHNKNLVSTFFKDAFYGASHKINTHGRIDMAIFEDDRVSVIIESKSPSNKSEFPSSQDINRKALQELVLYYMQQRIEEKNLSIKHLIITNNFEWYIFDAAVFEKYFADCKEFSRVSKEFISGQTSSTKTHDYYGEIAKPRIEEVKNELDYVYFNLKENIGKQQLVQIYKLLCPSHLLKQIVVADSNSLNTAFYNELLYIIGLEEHTEGSKTLIGRCAESTRKENSLLESTIYQLSDRGYNEQDLFEKSLNLVIAWINRILFLKLLESQLISYHDASEVDDYRFLTIKNIYDYDGLNELFFKVLAVREGERHSSVAEKYARVPYLNSSLFERTKGEQENIEISGLKMGNMPLYGRTVLKDIKGRRIEMEMSTLEYLFRFLDAYDFGSEQNNELTKAESKTLINASVLGLIFEKINGYKDGSFFTPGVITEYMSREVLRMLIVQKFNEAKGWNCQSLTEVYNKIDGSREDNEIINSITICDPAVGSGHFLVSALNEIIAIKSELGILMDKNGKRLRDWKIYVENDELIVQEKETGNLFHYNTKNEDSRIVQETLFNEKRRIIENSLFGVDINPNSVNICRLRLWIELLKYAYYRPDGTLETLPNIDINIKCGNSLVSKYPVRVGESIGKSANLRKEIAEYKAAVKEYKKTADKVAKRHVVNQINIIKSRINEAVQLDLFDEKVNQRALENNIYSNSMEWMIEFPEVLDEDGRFLGFDIVIANPPYIDSESMVKQGMSSVRDLLKKRYAYLEGNWDIYMAFFEFALCVGTYVSFITPDKWLSKPFGKSFRKNHMRERLSQITRAGSNVFANAQVDAIITQYAPKSEGLSVCEFQKSNEVSVKKIGHYDISHLQDPFLIDYLFSDEVGIIQKMDLHTNKLSHLAECESACATSDAYKLKPLIFNCDVATNSVYKVINTGTISKYYNRWGLSPMKYLSDSYLYPTVNRQDFESKFGASYTQRARRSKLIFKGLNLLDVCLDESGEILPAKSTNVICSENIRLLKYLCGLLNSKLIFYYLKTKYISSSYCGGITFTKDMINYLPLVSLEIPSSIVSLVDQIIGVKKQNPSADTTLLENKIDCLVYQLYDLSINEIRTVESKMKSNVLITTKNVSQFVFERPMMAEVVGETIPTIRRGENDCRLIDTFIDGFPISEWLKNFPDGVEIIQLQTILQAQRAVWAQNCIYLDVLSSIALEDISESHY